MKKRVGSKSSETHYTLEAFPNIELLFGVQLLRGREFLQNLSSYREAPKPTQSHSYARGISKLEFDIERHVIWSRDIEQPPCLEYSMMINGLYHIKRGREEPSAETFITAAAGLEGFEPHGDMAVRPWFVNRRKNVFTNWAGKAFGNGKKVTIGVIQQEPVASLGEVVHDIVPYAAEIYNRLNPTRQLAQDIIERSVELAIASDEVAPPLPDI